MDEDYSLVGIIAALMQSESRFHPDIKKMLSNYEHHYPTQFRTAEQLVAEIKNQIKN